MTSEEHTLLYDLKRQVAELAQSHKSLDERFERHAGKEQDQNERIDKTLDRLVRIFDGELDSTGGKIPGLVVKVDQLYTQFIQDKGIWKRIANFLAVGAALGMFWTVFSLLKK